MRRVGLLTMVLAGLLGMPFAHGELQNIEIGGKIEIYGAWYSDVYEPRIMPQRIPAVFLPLRAIGPNGTASAIRAGDRGNTAQFFEQRTRLHVAAEFSDDVRAFIEFDSIDTWGEDFRSDYITGADARAATADDVEVFQAYFEADRLFDTSLRLRMGRQEMVFGSGWLVGCDCGPDPFTGLSFDAIRLTCSLDVWTIDAWWAKVAERTLIEEDGDTNFYGIYATYTGLPSVELDAYWLYVRDAAAINDTNFIAPLEWAEDILGLDDYDVTNLHTVGVRAAGQAGALDFEAEAAYQWGEADSVGALFVRNGLLYGDDGARYDSWAGHGEIGYTVAGLRYTPRVYLGGSYYGGEDHRDTSFREWVNPFSKPQASVSFNRMFTSWMEDDLIDASAKSNFWKAYLGLTAAPTDAIEVDLRVTYLEAVAPFDLPVSFSVGDLAIPIAPALPFWTERGAKDIGWQAAIVVAYQYSEDLGFEAGYTHSFLGGAIEDGVFADEHALTNIGGEDNNDVDYVYFMATVEF